MLLSQITKLIVIDVACANHDHIFGKVHTLMVIHDHVPVNFVDVINFPEDREAHHVLPVNVVVNVFHQGFEAVIVC
jgi:hypothetical protein